MKLQVLITLVLLSLSLTFSFAQSHTNNCVPEPDLLDGQPVYTIVDQMPEYPGGLEELMKFLGKKTKYQPLKGDEIPESKVHITFIVDTNGEVVNECVINIHSREKLSPLELEVLRVATSLTNWRPGSLNGKKVPIRYYIPVQYCLSSD